MKNAIVLLSGGQDSATCLFWALKKFDKVYAVGYDYGQKHKKELEQANKICKKLKINYKIFDVKNLLSSSSLTDNNQNHNEKSKINQELPASFVAGRNILFINIASIYGAELKINDIVTGVCQTDFSGYPDCRKVTMDALQNTLSLGLGIGDIRIHTPLMYLTKAETFKLAKELNCLDVIINETMTDYNGNTKKNYWGYGDLDNPASRLRKAGYDEAKQKGWI